VRGGDHHLVERGVRVGEGVQVAGRGITDPALRTPNDFFGGQRTIEVFSAAANQVPISYLSPYDSIIRGVYQNELNKVESQGKDPEQAWNDVQREVSR
jgi:cellobiose transport system substrate-binding protein